MVLATADDVHDVGGGQQRQDQETLGSSITVRDGELVAGGVGIPDHVHRVVEVGLIRASLVFSSSMVSGVNEARVRP